LSVGNREVSWRPVNKNLAFKRREPLEQRIPIGEAQILRPQNQSNVMNARKVAFQ